MEHPETVQATQRAIDEGTLASIKIALQLATQDLADIAQSLGMLGYKLTQMQEALNTELLETIRDAAICPQRRPRTRSKPTSSSPA